MTAKKQKVRGDFLTRFTSPYAEEMAKAPVSVVLPAKIDEYVRSLPNRTEWLRQAIAAQVERDQQAKSST